MSNRLVPSLVAALVMSLAPACTTDNPLFGLSSQGDATTMDVGPTSSGAPGPTTTAPGTTTSGEDSSSGPPGTTAQSSSVTDPVDTGTTTADETSTNTSEAPPDTTTGMAEPYQIDVYASLATCVILGKGLPYIGPIGCEAAAATYDAVDETGVMVVSQAYAPKGGQEARIYLRFEIPPSPDGLTLAEVTLTMQVSDDPDAGAPWSGIIYLTDPYDPVQLNVFAPNGPQLVLDPGPASPGQVRSWPIELDPIVPGTTLRLGVGAQLPGDGDVVAYRSNNAPMELRPKLKLVYQDQ